MQVNTWGGPTKEFQVEADLNKLEAYNVTVAQLLSAVGNANVNVGGAHDQYWEAIGEHPGRRADRRWRRHGPRSRGYKVNDIENITLGRVEMRPGSDQGCRQGVRRLRPRLGKEDQDDDDDIWRPFVVMNRTVHTNDMIPRIKADAEKLNQRRNFCHPASSSFPIMTAPVSLIVTTNTVLAQPHFRMHSGFS